MSTRRVCAALSIAVAALCGCAGPGGYLDDAEYHFQRADYYQAHGILVEALQEHPGDPEIERRLRRVRLPYLLKTAQELVFRNQDAEALDVLARVQVLDPDNEVAARWTRKAKRKLAARAALRGDDLRVAGDLEAALAAYHEALTHVPGYPDAEEGKAKLSDVWSRKRDKAVVHYLDGVRTLAEQQFGQTTYHMGIALTADPSLDRAKEPASLAARRLAEQRYARAQEMQDAGFHEPALREYTALVEEYPELSGIRERIAHMQREVEAQHLADRGEMAVFRGEFTSARSLLEKAYDMSVSQRESIGERLALVQERELEHRYVLAKDLELQHQYEEAIAAYQAIDEAMPGFEDVRARISQLEASIEEAEKSYEAGVVAETNGDTEAAIEAFGDALLFYPGYRDAEERLARLRM